MTNIRHLGQFLAEHQIGKLS